MRSASDADAREPRGLNFWQALTFTEPDQLLENLKSLDKLRAEAGRRAEPFDVIAPLAGPLQNMRTCGMS